MKNPKKTIALSGKSQKYWQERATQRLLDSEKESQVVINRLHRIYSEARKRTVQNILDMHKAYYKQNGWDAVKLNQLEPTGNIAKFYKMLEKEGLLTSLPERFKGRITREMALNAQLWAESAKIGLSQEKLQTALNQRIYTSVYSGTIKDVKGDTVFSNLDTQTVSQVMKSKFYGKNFSERIWKNSDALANSLQERLSRSFITGQSYSKTASEIANAFNTSESNAMRLVRTEGNYFHNKGNIDAYTEMGYKKLKFSAVLDTRTSEVCQAHNNKIYDIDKIVQGDNAPPLHPNCRSIMLAVIGTNRDAEPEPEEEALQEKPKVVSTKTNNEQPTIRYHTGKVLGNREDLRPFVGELSSIHNKLSKNFLDLLTGKEKVISVAQLTKNQINKYSKLSGINIKDNARLLINSNTIRHLLNSGHITGKGRNNKIDKKPLTPQDLLNVKEVFINAEIEKETLKSWKGVRFKLEYNGNEKQRLILEVEYDGSNLSVVTFFNIS